MAVSRVKSSSVLQGFPKYRSMLAGNAGYDPAATWLIQRVTATGGETSITFSSIPQTYSSLQIRYKAQRNTSGVGFMSLRLNGVSTTGNYTQHSLEADGSTVTAAGLTASSYPEARGPQMPANSTANTFGNCICDIHDYTSTTKNKTIRWFGGWDNNGSGVVGLYSNAFLSTSAVTSLTVYFAGDAVSAGSTFALYGMV